MRSSENRDNWSAGWPAGPESGHASIADTLKSSSDAKGDDLRVSVVIPTLNEEKNLPSTLPPVLAVADEVIVSDGGSRDQTREVAEALGARVVTGPPGRGGQLNLGARAASGGVLLFLHADTRLGEGAIRNLREAVASGAAAGGFFVCFDEDRPSLRLGSWLINRRTAWTRLPLGDQAQFMTRSCYAELGGFRDWPILEDFDMARRMKRRSGVVLLGPPVTTAARRFLRLGVVRTVATNWLIWGLYFLGVSPVKLARLYQLPRRSRRVD